MRKTLHELATDERKHLLVVAPPGCGKTELLAHRAGTLIGRLGLNQRILALTFSNRARDNLGERLCEVLGHRRFRRYLTVRNFHGHATEVIRAHGRTLGINPEFTPPGRLTLDDAIRELTDELEDRDAWAERDRIVDALGSAKRQPFDDDEVDSYLRELGNENALRIERDRRAQGTLHYDDLLRHAERLLRVPAVANLYQQHFAAVLVDEFQDLSPQQLEIAVRSGTVSQTFVGDPLQGIYSWAGARSADVEDRLRGICGEPETLHASHRSSPAVLDAMSGISEMLGREKLEAADPGAWHQGGAASALAFRSGTDEAAWIVATTASILERNPAATIGVITRSGWRRKPIDEAFAAATDIPCTRWDLAVDDQTVVDRLRAAASGLSRAAGFEDLEAACQQQCDPHDVDLLAQIREAIASLRLAAGASSSLSATLQQLRVRDDDRAVPSGVHLLNAHTGKGQQFDWVFIPGFEGGHIPSFRATTEQEIAEELRTVLVMLSRARHGVVISRANQLMSRKNASYSTKASPWATAIVTACPMDRARLLAHIESLG